MRGALAKLKMLFLLALFVGLAACQQENDPPDLGLEGFDPHMVENERAACTARGGRFGKGGLSGGFFCFETPKDANKHCTKASDCEGECLARSLSCSPVIPLVGCNEVLTITGSKSTLCRN